MTTMTFECCVLKGSKGLTDERIEPPIIIGTLGTSVKLQGYLETPTQRFYKDNQVMYATEHYELMTTPVGYQVNIRFLTCTDKGTYKIGSKNFNLSANTDTCSMLYYNAKVYKVKTATRTPMMVMPDLKELEDVKTSVKLLNVSDSTLYFSLVCFIMTVPVFTVS